MALHRLAGAGAQLRLAGAVLLCIAGVAAARMFGDAGHPPRAIDYPLALIAFAGASAGSVLLVLGGHLFDQVELSQRWTRTPGPRHEHGGSRAGQTCDAPPGFAPAAAERTPGFSAFG